MLTRAVPGREEEFHDWYERQHLADCTLVPGIKSVKRLKTLYRVGRRSEGSPVLDKPYDSVALYEIEADDPLAVARELSARSGSELMPYSDSVDSPATLMMMAESGGER